MSEVVEYSFHARRMRGGGLRVSVGGPRSLENTIAYWNAILAEVHAERPQWLLVCDDLRGPELTAADWRALVDAMVGRGLEGVRIAHVKPSGLAQIEHCELSAREAGLDARAFTDLGVAERWLRYGDAEAQGDANTTPSAPRFPGADRRRRDGTHRVDRRHPRPAAAGSAGGIAGLRTHHAWRRYRRRRDPRRAVGPRTGDGGAGNNDRGAWADALPDTATIACDNVKLLVVHDRKDLDIDPRDQGIDVVVCGHSHRPSIETRDGVLYVNPGSAGPRRFRLPVTVALLDIEGNRANARLLPLLPD